MVGQSWLRPLVVAALLAALAASSRADSLDLAPLLAPASVSEFADFVSLPSPIRRSSWRESVDRSARQRSARPGRPARYRDPWSLRMEAEKAKFRPSESGESAAPPLEAPPDVLAEMSAEQLADALFPEMDSGSDGSGDPEAAAAEAILALVAGFDGGETAVDGPEVPEAAKAVAQYLTALSDGAMQLVFNLRWLVGKGMRLDTANVVFGRRSELNPRATQERKVALERDRQAGADKAAMAKTQKVVRSVSKIAMGVLLGLVGWFIIRSF
jgi:hypothetical protein